MSPDVRQADPDRALSLSELIEARKNLDVALAVHEASLRAFWAVDRPWFAIQQSELSGENSDDAGGRPRHLTSSASCFESLADLRPGLDGRLLDRRARSAPPWNRLASEFARRTLAAGPVEWTSDDAAHVYCRVRTLPAVLRYSGSLADEQALASAAKDRLEEAFAVVGPDRPIEERGLGERSLGPEGAPIPQRPGESYPANTFHAYWGLKANRRYLERRDRERDLPQLSDEHLNRVRENEAWVHGAMSRHTALLHAQKRRGDAQQLAFAVLADLLANGRRLTPATEQHDLYEAAMATFFAAQEPSGRWPLSLPLFHYPMTGNAYCYTFETLTELLRPALPREEGRVYRALLEPFLARLFAAWDYAIRTRVPLDEQPGGTYGWSSTHHVGREDPEAWATAEVFSFGQMLRCVSGHVVAERAAAELGARRPSHASRVDAERELASRGDTWAQDGWTVGRQLASLFLHPASAPSPEPMDVTVRDPDARVIGKAHARSAVLFGPPGTGKTSIVESLAGALGWQFVEILASDFLRDGVDGVPAQADRIFELLMQVDRCVVLFDEIDELIRDRTQETSDPFGRFLTTSMLPKIAKLWKQGRVFFFVATNHVGLADPAITRTSRFDARIFVAPPGINVKSRELARQLEDAVPVIDRDKVVRALAVSNEDRREMSTAEEALAVLPLLRFDQIPELARRLRAAGSAPAADLNTVLEEMRDDLLRHEWQPSKKPPTWSDLSPAARLRFVYHEYVNGESRDFSRERLMRLSGPRPSDWPPEWQEQTGHNRLRTSTDHFYEAPEAIADLMADDGLLHLDGDPAVSDGDLLWWRVKDRERG